MSRQPRLKFIVVGASVAGLATAYTLRKAGHDVLLLDMNDGKVETVTAIEAPPNMIRIMKMWGLGPLLHKTTEVVERLEYRDGENGQALGVLSRKMLHQAMNDTSADFCCIPDSKLRTALYQLAEQEGVSFRFKTRVVDADSATGSLTLANGEQLSADLIIGADGFYSKIRKCVLEKEMEEDVVDGKTTVQVTIAVPLEKMIADELLRPLADPVLVTWWVGDGYSVRTLVADERRSFFVTMVHVYHGPVTLEDKRWRTVEISELGRFGIDVGKLDERLQKIFSLGDSPSVKVFTNKRPADSLVCPRSRFILVGDAAHLLAPGNQNARTISLEDAQTLGCLFARLQRRDQVGPLTTAYDEIRHPRSLDVFQYEENQQMVLMAPKGPVRDARNSLLQRMSTFRVSAQIDEDAALQGWGAHIAFFSYHADEKVDDWWSKYGASIVKMERKPSILSNMEISVERDKALR